MKTRFSILTGIAALALVFGLAALAACSNPTGSGSGGTPQPAPAPQSTTLMGTDFSGNAYVLEITENKSRAAYTGKAGDGFKLIIILANGSEKICTGTIQAATSTEYTLKPNRGSNFKVKQSNGGIAAITNTTGGTVEIAPDDGSTPQSVPASIGPNIPVASNEDVTLYGTAENDPVPLNVKLYLYPANLFSASSMTNASIYAGKINENGKLDLGFLAHIQDDSLVSDLQGYLRTPSGTNQITNISSNVTVTPNTIKFVIAGIQGSYNSHGIDMWLGKIISATEQDQIQWMYVNDPTMVSGATSFTTTKNFSVSGDGYTSISRVNNGTISWNNVRLQKGWNKVRFNGVFTPGSDTIQDGAKIETTTTAATGSNISSTTGYKWLLQNSSN
jgi:hypothetical protein